MTPINNRHFLWLISGVLLASVFLSNQFWWYVLPGIVIFLIAVENADSTKTAFFGGLLVGTIKSLGALVSIWYIYPLTWIGIEPGTSQIVIIALYWFLFSFVIGLPLAVLAVLGKKIEHNFVIWLITFPLLLVLSEMLGSFLYSVLVLGPGSSPNIYFSFGYLGYALADINIILPLASVAGVYSLTFLVASLGVVFYVFGKKQLRLYGFFGIILFLLVVGVNYFLFDSTPPALGIKATSINTYFDSNFFKEEANFIKKEEEIRSALKDALMQKTDIIILPEDSRFTTSFILPELALNWILNNTEKETVLVVDSSRIVLDDGQTIIRSYIYDTKMREIYVSDKQYLVPLGEFLPYIQKSVVSLFGSLEIKDRIFNDMVYVPGPVTYLDTQNQVIPGVLFCMESVSSLGVKNLLVRRNFPYIVHPVSHAWFNQPKILDLNLNRMLKVQSVWNTKPIVTAGNMADSLLFLPSGKMLKTGEYSINEYWSLSNFEF